MKTLPKPNAFDRFYYGGRKPTDAMDLAVSDAIHAKQEHAEALMAYRDNYERLRATVEALLPYADKSASANEVTGWASRSHADAANAREVFRLTAS